LACVPEHDTSSSGAAARDSLGSQSRSLYGTAHVSVDESLLREVSEPVSDEPWRPIAHIGTTSATTRDAPRLPAGNAERLLAGQD